MQDVFNRILNEYLSESSRDFNSNPLADFIRNDAVEDIALTAKIDLKKYALKGSAGQGNWGTVPWIGIFDREISTSAQEGYDIVYLFRADMSGVYISLNQGWTYYKKNFPNRKPKDKISAVSIAWKHLLSSALGDFNFDKIDLKANSNSDLPEGYERGHICGKLYEKGSIPSEEELINDLRYLMGVLREVKGNFVEGSFHKTNIRLLADIDLGFIEDKEYKHTETAIDNILTGLDEEASLIETSIPEFSLGEHSIGQSPTRKTDYIAKAKRDIRVGLAGEKLIFEYEKEQLRNAGRADLAQKVEHTSQVKGDGYGYDILSYTTSGEEKYIEVKSTTGDIQTPFYLSGREVEFSTLNSANYQLFRVYKLDPNQKSAMYYVLNGDLSIHMKLTPTQFISAAIF